MKMFNLIHFTSRQYFSKQMLPLCTDSGNKGNSKELLNLISPSGTKNNYEKTRISSLGIIEQFRMN